MNTLKGFINNEEDIDHKIPEYESTANLEFLQESMGWTMEPREINFVDIDESTVQSGDFFGVVRLDGTSPMIMYGTGAHFSHCTMALRFPEEDNALYIVESQGSGYWPHQAIQRTPFSEWVDLARERDFNVVWLPLDAEHAAAFDVNAAVEFWDQTGGLPYGFHTFMYGWIDTPRDNLPGLMPNQLIPIALSLYEHVAPKKEAIIYNAGINIRLGTEGLTTPELAAEAANQGMSLQDVMAIVNMDDWTYTGLPNDGRSYVCSSYVSAQYKAAGLYGDMSVQATEHAPRDVYMLNFFDKERARPEACVTADPTLPYCQIMGKYRIDIPIDTYSVMEPYPHMSEHCATNYPSYDRDAGC